MKQTFRHECITIIASVQRCMRMREQRVRYAPQTHAARAHVHVCAASRPRTAQHKGGHTWCNRQARHGLAGPEPDGHAAAATRRELPAALPPALCPAFHGGLGPYTARPRKRRMQRRRATYREQPYCCTRTSYSRSREWACTLGRGGRAAVPAGAADGRTGEGWGTGGGGEREGVSERVRKGLHVLERTSHPQRGTCWAPYVATFAVNLPGTAVNRVDSTPNPEP